MRHYIAIALLWVLLAVGSTAQAQLRSSYPYICSDGNAYSVRAVPFPMAGINLRGIFQKFQAFCKSGNISLSQCSADNSPQTLRCYKEFRLRGNITYINGKVAVQPGRIRHNASAQWFEKLAEANEPLMKKTCRPAVVAVNCSRLRQSEGHQLRCLYEKSSFAARSMGRGCYSALNVKLDAMARQPAGLPSARSVANNDSED